MNVYFSTGKMQKICSSEKSMQREYGPRMTKRLQQRLAELEAVDNLEQMSRIPSARCHELTGDRKGQLSVDLVHPQRLIFVPDQDLNPRPLKGDGGLDWSLVTAVVVLEIVDTH